MVVKHVVEMHVHVQGRGSPRARAREADREKERGGEIESPLRAPVPGYLSYFLS